MRRRVFRVANGNRRFSNRKAGAGGEIVIDFFGGIGNTSS